ncbi:MAG TPA: hypothetical protein VMV49_01480 [Candidatus Deferrimicrobium sp.]|nr:hypothetical protein [Candidatus Deferrimicrobium sp.]
MKTYNITNPRVFNQSDIEIVAMQAAAQIEILNNVIRDTYAYNWTGLNGGNSENNYIFMGMENYFILNNYPRFTASFDPDLIKWINWTFFPMFPEILQLELWNWEIEMYFSNISIVLNYGQFTKYYSNILGLDLSSMDPYMIANWGSNYNFVAALYEDSLSSMSSALLLMTIAAVVLAYVVLIRGRAYIWISLVLGLIVSIIGLYMFITGVQYYLDTEMIASMFMF